MKKIIALAVAVAMIFALATISAFADDGHYVWNHTGSYAEDPWSDSFRIGHDCPTTGTIRFKTDVSFSKVIFAKIWATPHCVVTLEVLSGGNSVFTGSFELFRIQLVDGSEYYKQSLSSSESIQMIDAAH